jgi:large subunit ribosomal protein L33
MKFDYLAPQLTLIKGYRMAKKGKIRVITLECTEARKENKSPSRYTTTKNTQTHPERLEKKKYNPNLRKHTVHREVK